MRRPQQFPGAAADASLQPEGGTSPCTSFYCGRSFGSRSPSAICETGKKDRRRRSTQSFSASWRLRSSSLCSSCATCFAACSRALRAVYPAHPATDQLPHGVVQKGDPHRSPFAFSTIGLGRTRPSAGCQLKELPRLSENACTHNRGSTELAESERPSNRRRNLLMSDILLRPIVAMQVAAHRLREREDGQTTTEYAILLGFLAIAIIIALFFLRNVLRGLFSSAASSVSNAPGG